MAIGMRLLLIAAVGLFLSAPAMAVEPICPGGSSPRSDIKYCADFEKLTANCATGFEAQCFIDNGITKGVGPKGSSIYDWVIKRDGGASGPNYASSRIPPGSVGVSILGTEPVPGFAYPPNSSSPIEIAFRHYIRFTNGFASFGSGHGGGPNASNVPFTGYVGGARLQVSTYSNLNYYGGLPSNIGGQNLYPNIERVTMLNNRWYLIEFYMKLDTACTDVNSHRGCNGIYRQWIDGIKTTEYTNLNLGGVVDNARWTIFQTLPGVYFHFGGFAWGMGVDYDQIALSDCTNSACTGAGPYIGASPGDSNRGAGDPSSPYRHGGFAYEAWLGRKPGGDCTKGGALGVYSAKQYRTLASLDSTIAHGGYADSCNSATIGWLPNIAGPDVNALMKVQDGTTSTDCTVGGGSSAHYCRWDGAAWVATSATDNSLKINLTGDCSTTSCGSGVMNVEGSGQYGIPNQWAFHGWIYLPSSNNYSATNLVLTGLISDAIEANASRVPASYVGLTVSGGKWAVKQVDGSGSGTVGTSTAVTFDRWHEYELIVWKDQTVSLMIDRTRLLTKASLPRSVAWAYPPNDASRVIGVIDFKGTAPFVVYYDDNDVLSASAWSCDGWGAASCPFEGGGEGGSGGGTDITGIPAPTGLTVR